MDGLLCGGLWGVGIRSKNETGEGNLVLSKKKKSNAGQEKGGGKRHRRGEKTLGLKKRGWGGKAACAIQTKKTNR